MKLTRKAATRVLTLVAAGGVVLGMSATAFAATPPYEPDPSDQIGQLLFYDASGNVVTSGSTTAAPFAKFAVATSDDPVAANTTATLFAYTPQNGVNPGLWSGEQLSGTTTFPVASPANIAAAGTHRPVVTNGAADTTLNNYIQDLPQSASSGAYQGLYQLRLLTPGNDPKYWAADIQITGTTWTLQYPSLAATTTAVAASPGSPQTAPASAVTLTATVTANAPGSVVFTDTDSHTQVGTTQTLPGGSTNTASVTIPAGLAVGTHHYTATYSPSVGALFDTSTGSTTYQVNGAPADTTNTSLSVTPVPGTVGDTTTFSSTVADTAAGHTATIPQGTVQYFDNGVAIAGASGHTDASGAVSAGPSAFGLASGPHSITATFTPDDPTKVNGSSSSPVVFSLSPPANDPCTNAGTPQPYPNDPRTDLCHDAQTVQVTVPRGNLFISTPYTPTNPFDLGTMQLAADGTTLHASGHFGTAAAPADGVTIIDTRSSGEGWTAAVTSTDFTKSGAAGPTGFSSINACNLGFVNVAPAYVSGNAISATNPIAVTQNPNASAPGLAPGAACTSGLAAGPHTFASKATNGTGSVNVIGDLDLYAPTSTQAGLYTATVTFSLF